MKLNLKLKETIREFPVNIQNMRMVNREITAKLLFIFYGTVFLSFVCNGFRVLP